MSLGSNITDREFGNRIAIYNANINGQVKRSSISVLRENDMNDIYIYIFLLAIKVILFGMFCT